MNQHHSDQMAKAIHATLQSYFRRNQKSDLVVLSEKLLDTVELVHSMQTEESGIAAVPESWQDTGDRSLAPVQPAVDWPLEAERSRERPNVQPPPAARNAVVSPESRSPIILKDDPEFNETLQGKVVGRTPVKILRPTAAPRKKESEKPVWEEGDLINRINEATPAFVEFETANREGKMVRIRCNKNIHNQAGMGSVLLTYVHPQINTQPADASVIIPMAKVPFSVYMPEIDIETAMNGPNGIMVQLKGMYRARAENMEPTSGPDPGPLRLDMRTQPGDYHAEAFTPGVGQTADPYQRDNAILQGALNRERRENDSLAPQGHRFNS